MRAEPGQPLLLRLAEARQQPADLARRVITAPFSFGVGTRAVGQSQPPGVRHRSAALTGHGRRRFMRSTLQPDGHAAERLRLDGDPAGAHQFAQASSKVVRGEPELLSEALERPDEDRVIPGKRLQDAPLPEQSPVRRCIAL
jgi:hypothetical protein